MHREAFVVTLQLASRSRNWRRQTDAQVLFARTNLVKSTSTSEVTERVNSGGAGLGRKRRKIWQMYMAEVHVGTATEYLAAGCSVSTQTSVESPEVPCRAPNDFDSRRTRPDPSTDLQVGLDLERADRSVRDSPEVATEPCRPESGCEADSSDFHADSQDPARHWLARRCSRATNSVAKQLADTDRLDVGTDAQPGLLPEMQDDKGLLECV